MEQSTPADAAARPSLVGEGSLWQDRCPEFSSVLSESNSHSDLRLRSHPAAQTAAPASILTNPGELLSLVLEACPLARYIVSPDARIETWNHAAESLLGFTGSEIVGQHTSVLMPDAFHQNWQRNFNAIATTKLISVDSIRRHKNGTLIDVEVTAAAMKEFDGSFRGVLVTLVDKRLLVEQQAKNAQLAAIVSASPIAVVSIDSDRMIRTWNAAAEALFGYTHAEVAGQHINIIVPPNLHDESSQLSNRIVELNKIEIVTTRRNKSGKNIPVRLIATPLINTAGGTMGLALFYHDIAEDLAVQRNLRASEEFSRRILGSSVDWISVLNDDNAQVYSNREVSIGQSTDLAKSTTTAWMELWPSDQRVAIEIALREVKQSGASQITAWRLNAENHSMWYDLRMIRLPNSREEARRLLIVARDITEKKNSDDHITLMIRELSHRAKNLLAVITAMARSTASQSQSLVEFEEAFCSRILGLSRSHDLLVRQDWRGAQFYTLVQQHLRPFLGVDRRRLTVSGVNVMVPPAVAQAIGMALHELATNAVKYGALSSASGRIHVSCIASSGDYEIEWSEAGGPIVRAPTQSGFGRVVVEDMVSEALDCDARIDFRPSGVVWSARLRSGATIAQSNPMVTI